MALFKNFNSTYYKSNKHDRKQKSKKITRTPIAYLLLSSYFFKYI